MFVSTITYIALAFGINLMLTPIIIRISHKYNWYDTPDNRKIHTEKTPRIGGIGLFLSFSLSVLVLALFRRFTDQFIPMQFFTSRNLLLFLGFILVHVIGLVDDFHNIPALYKLGGQILAGAFVALGGALIDGIYLPIAGITIPLGPMSGVVTIFWLISISNAVNLIDGMDGLAGSTVLIASGAIGLVHLLAGNNAGALYSFILCGSVLAFLFFNKPRAHIFMGDSGSLFLGFVLGSLAFIGPGDSSVPLRHFEEGFIITSTVLIIPIADMFASILRRIRMKKPIYAPDKAHIHHKLLSLGMSPKAILAVVTVVNLLMAGAVIAREFYILRNETVAGDILLLAAWLAVIILFLILHYVHQRRG